MLVRWGHRVLPVLMGLPARRARLERRAGISTATALVILKKTSTVTAW
jgi:hypothetical protein